MTPKEIIHYLLVWSSIGSAAFFIYVIVVFRSGMVYTSRKQDGTLKERIPLSGILNMLLFLVIIIGFQVLANYFGLKRESIALGYGELLLLNYGHYFMLFLFDTVVIDGLVLGVWRPGFMKLSDEIGAQSMKKHILVSIPVGLIAGAGLTAISSAISYFIFIVK